MLKWILLTVGMGAALAAAFAGVLWFVFTRDGDDVSALTETASAEVVDLKDVGSSYVVVYQYTHGGQKFYGETTVYSNTMERGNTIVICVDPADPSRHTEADSGCPPQGPSGLYEGVKTKPTL